MTQHNVGGDNIIIVNNGDNNRVIIQQKSMIETLVNTIASQQRTIEKLVSMLKQKQHGL